MKILNLIALRGGLAIFLLILIFLPSFFQLAHLAVPTRRVLAVRELSLQNRQPDKWVNGIFEDNILLTLAYARNKVKNSKEIDWNEVKKPFEYTITLSPGELFAFHEDVLSEYKNKKVVTTNAHFNYQQGFKYDGFLVGDGVCHLASLIYWAGQDAQLHVKAPTNHDFAHIENVPKKYGVSIFYMPGNAYANALQNVYLTNNREKAIDIQFTYNGEKLKVAIIEKG